MGLTRNAPEGHRPHPRTGIAGVNHPLFRGLAGVALVGLAGSCRAPSNKGRRSQQDTPAINRLSFVERFESVPAQQRSLWLIRQLGTNRFPPGSQDPAWPHFESECKLHLHIDVPKDRAYPRRKERRPGRPYAQPLDQRSESHLVWSSPSNQSPSFAIERSVEGGEREVILRRNKTLWTHRENEAWSQRPVDDDFHLRWVWEHRRCVAELLELAGPALKITPLAQKPAGRIELSLALQAPETAKMARGTTQPRRGWREFAHIVSLSGRLTMDAQSGAWLDAIIDTTFSVSPPKGDAFKGEAHLQAQTRPLSATQLSWPSPTQAKPLPQPPRYHREQYELLRGLAPGAAGSLGTLR